MSTQHIDWITEDLWNEHHYQITATCEFYAVLYQNIRDRHEPVGDEPSLTSALVHTRSLLEFYRPTLTRRHHNALWWVTPLPNLPRDNKPWHQLIGSEWAVLNPWLPGIHTFLAHLSAARRTLDLPTPPDKHSQRWPLDAFTKSSLSVLDRYTEYLRNYPAINADVLAAVEEIRHKSQALWDARRRAVRESVGLVL